jgi:hypothetical protein
MSDVSSVNTRRSDTVLRWAARLVGLAVLGLYLAIFVGEGFPRRLSAAESGQMALFLVACLGLLLAWRWEVLGGALTLAGLALFYANEHRLTGRFPRGFGFAVAAVPAVLFLVAATARGRSAGLGAGPSGD